MSDGGAAEGADVCVVVGIGSGATEVSDGVDFSAPETCAPHNEQNFLPGFNTPPHCLHKRGVAHLGQNFFPCATSAPQLLHVIILLTP